MKIFDLETTPNRDMILEHPEAYASMLERKKLTAEQSAIVYPWSSVICCSVYDEDTREIESTYGAGEEKVVKAALEMLSEGTLCGFNIKGFDIPMLCFRAVALGFKIPKNLNVAGKKPWEISHIDLLEHIKFGGHTANSLNDCCLAFGIPSPKQDMNGLGVYEAAKAGRYEEIAAYCVEDVKATTKLLRKLQKAGVL